MDDAQTDAPKWTPDQPLPVGATDDQFMDRRLWLRYHGPFGREDEIARAERAALASPRATGSLRAQVDAVADKHLSHAPTEQAMYAMDSLVGDIRALLDASPSLASAPSSHIVTDSALAAILHQLEVGEASTGDVRDVAWCAKELRAYIEASLASATAGDLNREDVVRVLAEAMNLLRDTERYWDVNENQNMRRLYANAAEAVRRVKDQIALDPRLSAASPPVPESPSPVTRFEVIDHRESLPYTERGRVLAHHDIGVELAYQDGGRTLKVFLHDRAESPSPVPEQTP